MPGERGAVGQPVPLHPAQSEGRGRSNWAPNHANGSWGPYSAWGAYPVWGGPYAPYVWGVPAIPYATTVIGALGGIPTQNGEARTAAGVIPKASLVKPIPGQRRQLNVAP